MARSPWNGIVHLHPLAREETDGSRSPPSCSPSRRGSDGVPRVVCKPSQQDLNAASAYIAQCRAQAPDRWSAIRVASSPQTHQLGGRHALLVVVVPSKRGDDGSAPWDVISPSMSPPSGEAKVNTCLPPPPSERRIDIDQQIV